jgi:serine/threonine protein kinase
MTKHSHILEHLAMIVHGTEHYILLPYARLGDLYQFLHCGKDPEYNVKYDFGETFVNLPPPGRIIFAALLNQCWSLAGAVKFLHNGIVDGKTSKSGNPVCAHMDLKPDNILIQCAEDSIVGKWMISDFGISVVHYGLGNHARPKLLSSLDRLSHKTMKTRPKRKIGTYQAPEIKHYEQHFGQPGQLSAEEGIGRKSDIWSYGCMFSEILAWAIGRDNEVERFNEERRKNGNNYFFTERVNLKRFEVRDSATRWLDGVPDESKNPPLSANVKQWARYWAETIKRILIIDANERPDANELEKLVSDVWDYNPQIPLENHSRQSAAPSDTSNPFSLNSFLDIDSSPPTSPNTPSDSKRDSIPASVDQSIFFDPVGIAHKFIAQKPSHPRKLEDLEDAIFAVALSHPKEATRVAFLTKKTVRIYNLNLRDFSIKPDRNFKLSYEEVPWDSTAGVSFAGEFLAVWGYSKKQKKKLVTPSFRFLGVFPRTTNVAGFPSQYRGSKQHGGGTRREFR